MIPVEVCRLLELSSEAAFVTDGDGIVLQANAAFGYTMGQSAVALAGQRLVDLASSPADQVAKALRFCQRSSLPVVGALDLHAADDEPLHFSYRAVMVRRGRGGEPTLLAFQREQGTAFRVLDEQVRKLRHEVRVRQQRERELAEAIELFQTVMDSLDALVYVADMESYEILFLNQYGRETFGDADGKRCWQVLQQGQEGPCTFCTNAQLLDGAGQPKGVYQWEFQNTQNQQWYDCRDRVIRWNDGRWVRLEIATNITERKQAEELLRASHQQLQDIVEFLPDATFAIDHEHRVVAWNKVMEEMTGVGKQHMLGTVDYAEPFFGKDSVLLIDLLQEPELPVSVAERYDYVRRQGQCLVAEVFVPALRSGQGAYLWVIAAPLLDADGRQVGAIESLRDITELKRAETELKQANRELDAFVYTVSHDLRTPLTPIIGFADYLLENCAEQLDETARQGVQDIIDSANSMLALMEDLLTLARLQKVERPAEPCALKQAVTTSVHHLSEVLAEADVSVEVAEVPHCLVPETLLVELMDNLIGNAVKYGCQPGDVVEIGGERTGARVRFYVRDYGPGIAEGNRQRIFEAFFRGEEGRKHRGTGIGLATVQKIAQLFGGRSWVEDTPGGGSTFWVELSD